MDFFELLVLLLFVVFPLLQQFLGRKGDEGEGPVAEAPPEREEPRPAAERALEPAPNGEGWSVGWGSWPEEAPAEEAPEPEVYIPEAVRVADPVVSMEALHVDRAAEHARIHAIHARPAARPQRDRPRLAALLSSEADIRRGIVLAEVLGPPAALRDPREF